MIHKYENVPQFLTEVNPEMVFGHQKYEESEDV